MGPRSDPSRGETACPACRAAVRPDDVFCPACGRRLKADEDIPTIQPAPPDRDRDRERVTEDEDRPRRRRDRDEDFDDYDDPRRFRRRDLRKPDPGLGVLVPVNQSGLAIVSGYLGLFSCFPLIGLVLGPMAIVLGVMALRAIKSDPDRSLGGAYRAIIGIVLGVINTILYAVVAAILIIQNLK
jgi:hypothetical protein